MLEDFAGKGRIMISASMAYNLLSGNMKQSLDRVASQATVKRDAEYFKDNINKVKDVDDFLGNYRLYSYAMTAYGLDDMTYAKAFMKKVLESDLTDANSFANKLSDSRYKEFAAAFNFNTPAADAQSDAQEDDLIGLYTQQFQDSDKAASAKSNYFKSAMTGVQSVDDLLGNSRLKSYVLTTFGIDPTYISNTFFKNVLTSDVNDPTSFVNTQANAKYQEMASYFNFNADGSVAGSAQTQEQQDGLVEKYTLNSLQKVVDYDDLPGEPADVYYVTSTAAQYNKAYYEKTIKTITSVDQLMGDARMVSYIKAAYSLGKHGYGQGISDELSDFGLRQVLTDANLASQLGLTGLHDAFNFNADGTVSGSARAQNADQTAATLQAASTNGKAYFIASINSAGPQTIDEFMADTKLVNFYRAAYNIPTSMTDSDFKSILVDADFAAAQGYTNVHDAFSFNPDGTVNGGTYQLMTAKSDALTAFETKLSYFSSSVSVFSLDALLADSNLANIVKVAYGMSSEMSDADFKQALLDPAAGYPDAVAAFNFQSDGTLQASGGAQNDAGIAKTSEQYISRYDDEAKDFIDDITANYKTLINSSASSGNFSAINNINDFLRDNKSIDFNKRNDDLPDMYHVALQAFGLTEAELPKSIVRKLLTSDAYDPKGYVASFKDDRITNFARAFNFGSDGKISSELQALPDTVMAKYATNFKSRATMGMNDGPLKDKAAKDATKAVDDFAKGIATVKSLDDFLKDDKLTSFVLKANGLDPKKYDEETLRKIFTSDPSDKKSYLNTKADSKFKEIVADFNFDTEGNLTRAKIGAIQNTGATERTQQSYLQQTLETQEGETNDGVRLALYFARKAPDITSLYTILGDKALFQVITTTYSLPSGISSMDVDKQVDLLKKFVNLGDLQDSKKVDKLMKRFTAMYDLQNNSGTSPALTILTNGGTTSTSLL